MINENTTEINDAQTEEIEIEAGFGGGHHRNDAHRGNVNHGGHKHHEGCGNHEGHKHHAGHGIHRGHSHHEGHGNHGGCAEHGNHGCGSADMQNQDGDESNNLSRLFQKCTHLMQHRKGHMQGRGQILITLLKQGELTQRELMDDADVRSSSISELMGKMESDGLISREKDENDKRNLRIALTEKGQAEAQAQLESRRQSSRDLFQTLNEEEKGQLENILGKLLDSWKQDGMHEGRGRCCKGHHKKHGEMQDEATSLTESTDV